MSATIDIVVDHRPWASAVPGVRGLARRAAVAALAASSQSSPTGDVTVVLANDATLRDLNHQFRGKNKPTNVLSFPAGDGGALPPGAPVPLGDIAIAFETVVGEAAAQDKTVADHLMHLVVHGVLHLRGYDHERATEAETMEALERDILARLGVADPYAVEAVELAR